MVLREGRSPSGPTSWRRGITTVLGVQPPIFGSPNVVDLLANGLDGVVGAKFAVEPDPEAAAVLIRQHIEAKRKGLGLPYIEPSEIGGRR